MALSQLSGLQGLQETEEERRRRLAAEAVAAGQIPVEQSSSPDAINVGSFAVGPNAQNLGGTGTQQDGNLGEKEAQARMMAPVVPEPQPTPVKQTIVTDPVTGRQTMKIEGSVEDLSAANPLTPTVVTPGAQPAAMPAAAPVDPNAQPGRLRPPIQIPESGAVAPAAAAAPAPVVPQMETQPGPAAGSTQFGMQDPQQQAQAQFATGPAAGSTQFGMQDPQQRAQAELAAASGPAAGSTQFGVMDPAQRAQATPFEAALTTSSKDPLSLLTLAKNPEYTSAMQQVFRGEAQNLLNQQVNQAKAEKEFEQLKNDPNALARMLRSSKDEGSWVKMIALSFLSPELAGREAIKLGLNAEWKNVQTADGRVMVKVRGDGLPMEGYNATTGAQLNNKDLVTAAAAVVSSGKQEFGGETFADPTGKIPGTFSWDKANNVYRERGTNRVATDEESRALRQIGVAGILSDQRAALEQKANISLISSIKQRGITNFLDAEAEYIKQQGPFGSATNRLTKAEFADIFSTQLNPPGVAPAAAAPAAAAPAAADAAPAAAPASEPAVPAAAPAAAQAPVRTSGAVAPTPVPTTTARPAPGAAAPAAAPARTTGPAVPGVGVTPTPGGFVSQSQRDLQAQQRGANIDVAKAGATEAIKTPELVRREDELQFVAFKNTDILPKAESGNRLAEIRRDQISGPDGVLNNKEIAGLLSGTGSQSREFVNLFRDVVAGKVESDADFSARIKAANITDQRMKDVLQVQLQRQRDVTPLMIREVAPVGAITDFEQRMAKDAGIDILRQGLYSSLTNLTRSQFQSDMAAYKSVFADQNRQLRTRSEFDKAWNAERTRIGALYNKVYTDRAKYLGKYNRDGKNNNATVAAFRDHFPVPSFDRISGQWVYNGIKSKEERPPLGNFRK